jgi:hypothetical protein
MEARRGESIVRLGPRIPSAVYGVMGTRMDIKVPNRVVEPRADTTSSSSSITTSASCGENACEKGVSGSTFTMPIVLGVV